MITKGTAEYKKAQQIANRIKDLADCPVSEETAEEVLTTILDNVMKIDCFAAQVAKTVKDSTIGGYYTSCKFRNIAKCSDKQAWIIACAIVENNMIDTYDVYVCEEETNETEEEAKETMTKAELTAWLQETNNQGNSVYWVVNGGGISCGYGHEIDNLIDVINSESYDDVIEVLGYCEEYDDFACTMLQEEFNEAKFLRVKHHTPYNSENIDIQIAYYNLNNNNKNRREMKLQIEELETIAQDVKTKFAYTSSGNLKVVIADDKAIIIGFDNIEQFEYAKNKYNLRGYEVSDYNGIMCLDGEREKPYPRTMQEGDEVWHKYQEDEFRRYYLGDEDDDEDNVYSKQAITRLQNEITKMKEYEVLVMNEDRDDYVPVEPAEVFCDTESDIKRYIGLGF